MILPASLFPSRADRMSRPGFALGVLVCLFAAGAIGRAGVWTEDYEAARKVAAESGRDLLLDFTGSDWCGYCIMLDAEVFSREEFLTKAPEDFVLVKIDTPKDPARQSEAVRAQNGKLIKRFAIEGYPTILLADSGGRPFASLGYDKKFANDPAGWLNHARSLRRIRTDRDDAFAEAAKSEGMDRARLLAKGLSQLDPAWFAAFYQKEMEMILAADADDTLGMRKALGQLEDDRAFEVKLEALSLESDKLLVAKKTKEAIGMIDAWLARENPSGERRQMVLSLKVDLLDESGDDQATLKLIDEVVRLDPRSATAADLKELADSIRK
jgi:thiol-disulfide isomerase/thioredoxin